MTITLSTLERDTLLEWAQGNGRFGSGTILFPEEERLKGLLKAHPGGDFEVNDTLMAVMQAWVESSVDGHFGSGAITNPVEKTLLDKIRKAAGEPGPAGFSGVAVPSLPAGRQSPVDTARIRNNRIIHGVVVGGILLAVILLTLSSWDKNEPAKGTSPIALDNIRIEFVVGTVESKKGENWVPVKTGATVAPDDSLKTGLASQVTLSTGGRSVKVEEARRVLVKTLF